MFQRNILKFLDNWMIFGGRKPLILRGARQTGKTVAVKLFGERFSRFVSLDLEREEDRRIFERSDGIEQVIQAIELAKGRSLREQNTLLFIDEIQNSPKAMGLLRFFHEDFPSLAVICAGSLLEAVMRREGMSFPVGRVQFAYLHPATFDEFLGALGEEQLLHALLDAAPERPPAPMVHDLALKRFHEYLLAGGMPEAVAHYAGHRSLLALAAIKDALLTAYEEDVSKYASTAEAKYAKFVIHQAPFAAGERIAYEHFGNSGFRSREMRRAFDLLEYAMLVRRVKGSPATSPPVEPNHRVAPKLLFLDSGLVAHRRGLRDDALYVTDLNDLFRGALAEQAAGQAFLAARTGESAEPAFWYRNRPGATAEVDYVLPFKGMLIPVEVKSGKTGRLRSLHQFLAAAPHGRAVRLYSGELREERLSVEGKACGLLCVPLYLQWRLEDLLAAWVSASAGPPR